MEEDEEDGEEGKTNGQRKPKEVEWARLRRWLATKKEDEDETNGKARQRKGRRETLMGNRRQKEEESLWLMGTATRYIHPTLPFRSGLYYPSYAATQNNWGLQLLGHWPPLLPLLQFPRPGFCPGVEGTGLALWRARERGERGLDRGQRTYMQLASNMWAA